MGRIEAANAYYVKLGRGGSWEQDCIAFGRLRLGWSSQSINDINGGRWDRITEQLQRANEGKPRQVVTNDLNRLRDIAESTEEDLWVTFHQAKLWWCRVVAGPIEEDSISKFRRTLAPWSDRASDGRLLVANELPGKIAQLQGFRGTACRVGERELLMRLLNGEQGPVAVAIARSRAELLTHVAAAVKELHWKDFETLVDLVFRDSGWVRISVLGQHAKAYDLELREPITGDRCVVQVKSKARLADLQETIANFSADDYRRVFFIVHSPAPDLDSASGLPEHVELMPPARLAERVLDAGLVGWLEDKVV